MKNVMKELLAKGFMLLILFGMISMGNLYRIKADDESPIEWDDTILPTQPGSYILQKDISMTQPWSVNGTVTIYLNGKNIISQSNDIINVGAGTVLNIYGDGDIKHDGFDSFNDGIVVDGGTLNMYGGTLSNNRAAINVKNGAINLGNSTSVPKINSNSFGIYTPSNSDTTITINNALISGNDKGLYIDGISNIVMNDGSINDNSTCQIELNKSSTSFTIHKGTISGTKSFYKEMVAHPSISIGSQSDPSGNIFIKGSISFNSKNDNLKIGDGYFDVAAYDSIKDHNFFYPGRKFDDSDKSGYEKMVIKGSGSHNIFREKDYTNTYEIRRSKENAEVNDNIEITVVIYRNTYALREVIVKGSNSGTRIKTETNDGVHFTFVMPDESVKVTAVLEKYYRVYFDLIHATSNLKRDFAFKDEKITFTLEPENEDYEFCYLIPENVEVSKVTGRENTYTFTMPEHDVKFYAAFLKHDHQHDGKTFFLWDQPNRFPAIDGSFALDCDMTLSVPWIQNGAFDLCLNGHTISCKRAIQHDDGSLFNLYDCQKTGKMIRNDRAESNLAISASSAQFHMYGGTITGFDVGIQSVNGSINIHKGTINTNNTAIDNDYGYITIGEENKLSEIFISGNIFKKNENNNVYIYDGYYDNRAHRKLSYEGENRYVYPKSRGFVASGRSDQYVYKIADITPYDITISQSIEHGTVTASAETALKDTQITLSITPAEHYELDSITVKDGNNEDVYVSSDNTFIMPGSAVTVSAAFKKKTYNVSFYSEDGTLLQNSRVEYGETPGYTGNEPTKASDSKYNYSFSGWTPVIVPVESDQAYTAVFTPEIRKYTVVFTNGDTVLQSTEVEYGQTPVYTKDVPIKTSSAKYEYSFSGWTPTVKTVTENATYTAEFSSTIRKYTVVFKNGDTVLQSAEVEYDQYPAYTEVTPTREGKTFTGWYPAISKVENDQIYNAVFADDPAQNCTVVFVYNDTVVDSKTYQYGATITVPQVPEGIGDEQYTKTFKGWQPQVNTTAASDVTYVALFDVTLKQYNITWLNGDGSVLKQETLPYGSPLAYEGTAPTKASTPQFDYSFSGIWTSDDTQRYDIVRRETTFSPDFNKTLRTYTVTWKDENGNILEKDENVPYGNKPIYNGQIPSKAKTAEYSYDFSWDPAVTEVTGDAVYKAKFTPVKNKYNIRFVNEDESLLWQSEVEYGKVPEYGGSTPVKIETDHVYDFAGWYPVLSKTVGDAKYTAVFGEVFTVDLDYNGGGTDTSVSAVEGELLQVPTPAPAKEGFNFAGWYESDDPASAWDFKQPVRGNMTLKAQYYPESVSATINGKQVMIATGDLEGKTVNNTFNDKPLVIMTNNGVIVVPANLQETVTIPRISNTEADNVATLNGDITKLLNMDITDHMYGIYLEVSHIGEIIDALRNEDDKQGYSEIEGSGFLVEFREICDNEGNSRHFDYPGTVSLNIDFEKMDIVLPEAPSDLVRVFYAGHNYAEEKVEYLLISLSADRKSGTFYTATLSPFDVVYKDHKRIIPPTPSYVIPKTGDR